MSFYAGSVIRALSSMLIPSKDERRFDMRNMSIPRREKM